MRQYILLDDQGFLIGVCESPFTYGLPDPIEVPDDLDLEKMDCYRYADGEFTFDAQKWMERWQGQAETELRNHRNELLRNCDHMVISDYPISEDEHEAWRIYRQALRDLSKQPGWPDNVVWPTPPTA